MIEKQRFQNRLQQIDQVIQQTTANAEESAATSEELSGQAAELKNQLGHFRLKSASVSNVPEALQLSQSQHHTNR